MKIFYIFILVLFVASCGIPYPENSKIKEDYFLEDLAKINSVGLMQNTSSAERDSLMSIYKKDTVNGLKELLVASGDLLKINVALNNRTLQEVYQKICDTIGMKFPELKCDEVQTTILPSKVGANDTDWVLVKIRFGETWYERQLYYVDNWQVDDFIYRLFNRKLADEGKPKRIHLVSYTCLSCGKKQDDFMGTIDVTNYGFIMLTKQQEDTLKNITALELEDEDQFAMYTTTQMKEGLQKFEATGLIDQVGQKWYDQVKTDVMQSSIYQQKDFYDFFDTLFSNTSFDTSNSYNPYEEILHSLSVVSMGKFNPSAIKDEETSTNNRTIVFNYLGDAYKFEAEQRGAYLSPEIIDNVNKALDDHNAGGDFYTVLTVENICTLVFIENKNVAKAKASGFFLEFEKGPSKEIKQRWESSL